MKKTLKAAFTLALPVMAGYLLLGATYGVLAHSMGFSIWYPVSMAAFIYSGSVEFLALGMLLAKFNPVTAATVALVVCARHLFYGLSMLERYRGTGWRKPFLIFFLTDETFAVNYNAKDASANEMFLVSVLDYLYWMSGAILGYLFGNFITADIRGLEFVITAMFATIFMDQFLKEKERRPALVGIGGSAVCLIVFGPQNFILPAMLCIWLALTLMRKALDKVDADKERKESK